MISADTIISQVKEKRRQCRQVAGDNVDTFSNYMKLNEEIDENDNHKAAIWNQETAKDNEKKVIISKGLQKTSTTSLAQESGKITCSDNNTYILGKSTNNNISRARASDNVGTFCPGDCEICPAACYWDYFGPGKWCFHRAYFLGKSGQPVHCDSAKYNCPLTT
jgi:hypothetical protein